MPFFGSSWGEDWYSSESNRNDTIQYFLYGIVVPLKKIEEEIKEYEHQEDVYGVFRGRDGKFVILGKVLEEGRRFGENEPLIVPKLDEVDELIIQNQVKENFGIEGKFHYYFVTK